MYPSTDLRSCAPASSPTTRNYPATMFAVFVFAAIVGLLAFDKAPASGKKVGGIQPTGAVYIIIDKSDYELQVYDEEGWLTMCL